MPNDKLTIDVDLGVQQLYDDAVAAAESYRALADRLAGQPNVCTHPTDMHKAGMLQDGHVVYCRQCGTTLVDEPHISENGREQ